MPFPPLNFPEDSFHSFAIPACDFLSCVFASEFCFGDRAAAACTDPCIRCLSIEPLYPKDGVIESPSHSAPAPHTSQDECGCSRNPAPNPAFYTPQGRIANSVAVRRIRRIQLEQLQWREQVGQDSDGRVYPPSLGPGSGTKRLRMAAWLISIFAGAIILILLPTQAVRETRVSLDHGIPA